MRTRPEGTNALGCISSSSLVFFIGAGGNLKDGFDSSIGTVAVLIIISSTSARARATWTNIITVVCRSSVCIGIRISIITTIHSYGGSSSIHGFGITDPTHVTRWWLGGSIQHVVDPRTGAGHNHLLEGRRTAGVLHRRQCWIDMLGY